MTNTTASLNGWIILDKPTGMTSAHAVAKVKKILTSPERGEVAERSEAGGGESSSTPSLTLPPLGGGKIKIGHAGTLDPLASGVLPLALGEATKTIHYMMDARKSYAFTASWGEKRDTDDREGKVLFASPKRPLPAQIEALCAQFLGVVDQLPPQFSALKVDGERAYELAREGKAADLKPRKVVIHSLKMTDYTADNTTFICECGKGTYIRAIARDMGDILGCYGHVSALRRLSVGKFSENDAISLENLEEMVHKDALKLLPVESALDDILALDITPPQATLLKRGQAIPVTQVSDETVLARCEGKAVALCSIARGLMKPDRVFNI